MKAFHFGAVELTVFSCAFLGSIPRSQCQMQCHEALVPCPSSNVMALGFTFGSLIHIGLVFIG